MASSKLLSSAFILKSGASYLVSVLSLAVYFLYLAKMYAQQDLLGLLCTRSIYGVGVGLPLVAFTSCSAE